MAQISRVVARIRTMVIIAKIQTIVLTTIVNMETASLPMMEVSCTMNIYVYIITFLR